MKSGIRVGYDNFGGMQVQFYESSTGKTAEINDWNNPLHLSLIAAPNYLYEGFGWFIKIGFNEFKLNVTIQHPSNFASSLVTAPSSRGGFI
ncbi:MAG: hypothetical protein O2900_17535 [Proteobacteria bacterium]|nr:hypothetical protein [Pseudomonadota bacterium]